MRYISEIVCARNDPICATVDTARRVRIWNLESGHEITSFNSVYGTGGSRLAISNDALCVFTGDYDSGIVTCYDIASGKPVWTCRIPKVQSIYPSRVGAYSYSTDSRQRVFTVNNANGERHELSFRACFVEECPESGNAIFVNWDGKVTVIGTGIRRGFDDAIGSAAIGGGLLGLAGLKSTIFLELEGGTEVQKFEPPGGFAMLHYSASRGEFFALQRGDSQGEWALVRLDIKTGGVDIIAKVGQPRAAAFSALLDCFVSSNGTVWDLVSGAIRGRLQLMP